MALPLPIEPAVALAQIIAPTCALLPSLPWDDRAAVMLLANTLQESDLAYRVQKGGGPARGLWQMELGGGVHGVMTHPASSKLAGQLLARRGVPKTERSAYLALAGDDLLAFGFARLLLWTDAKPLPDLGDVDGSFVYYLRLWRPGAYTRGTDAQRAEIKARYARNYAVALATVQGNPKP